MNVSKLAVYMIIMAGVTYLIRMLPLIIFRKKIKNKFIKSFLFYIPYAVLAAMTFPAILSSTNSLISAVCGLAVAVILSFLEKGLFPVAVSSCLTVFAVEFIMTKLF